MSDTRVGKLFLRVLLAHKKKIEELRNAQTAAADAIREVDHEVHETCKNEINIVERFFLLFSDEQSLPYLKKDIFEEAVRLLDEYENNVEKLMPNKDKLLNVKRLNRLYLEHVNVTAKISREKMLRLLHATLKHNTKQTDEGQE